MKFMLVCSVHFDRGSVLRDENLTMISLTQSI